MPKKKAEENKIRVDPEVMAEVQKVRAAYMAKGLRAPTQKALILAAWRAYVNAGTPEIGHTPEAGVADSSTAITNFSQEQGAKYVTVAPGIDVTPGECKWVIRFVNILRSGSVAARGIKWNVMMVAKAMGLWDDESAVVLPRPSEDAERASRKEIELAERLIAESEADPLPRAHPRKGNRPTKRSPGT